MTQRLILGVMAVAPPLRLFGHQPDEPVEGDELCLHAH